MIPASLYSTIYLTFVVILTIFVTSKSQLINITNIKSNTKNNIPGYILAIALAIFIGLRPMNGYYFVDMANYNENYYVLFYGRPFKLYLNTENLIFDNIFIWLAANYYDITVFFVLIAICYFVFTYKAMTRLFGNWSFLAFVVFLGAFSTYSYATNGIKAGAAAAFFLCALGYWRNKKMAAVFLLLSLGFHHSMIMPIAAYIVAWFVNRPKMYFIIWILSFLIAAAHISFFQEIFAGMADESGAAYLTSTSDSWGGKSGFRLDFVIYSALPIFIGYLAIYKYHLKSPTYSFLLNVYLLTNSIWMLCMYASFTNRIAYLSWLMYPVVTIYPFFCPTFMPQQTTRLKQVIWLQLLFTLFMQVIYYG